MDRLFLGVDGGGTKTDFLLAGADGVPVRRFRAGGSNVSTLGPDFKATGKKGSTVEGAAAIGEWVPVEEFSSVQNLHFRLDVNGQTVQSGCTSDMLWKVNELVAYISRFFTLKTGDMLFTGTPAGIGPVAIDDHLEGYIEERRVLAFNVK